MSASDKLWDYLQGYAAKHKAAGNGFGYGIADPNGVSRTLSARYYKDGSEILIAQAGKILRLILKTGAIGSGRSANLSTI